MELCSLRESKSVVNILTLQARPPVSGIVGPPSTLLAQHLPPPGRPSSPTSRRSSSWRSRGCGTGGATLRPVPPEPSPPHSRLRVLESENMRLSATINSTNRQVDIRLNEIEQRLEEDSSQEDFSVEEEEKNQESFI